MRVIGVDLLERVIAGQCPAAKLVLNFSGAICFPLEQQHRDQQAAGIRYADDSAGNALAAIVRPDQIEIRGHRDFSPESVATLLGQLAAQPGLTALNGCKATYRGEPIHTA